MYGVTTLVYLAGFEQYGLAAYALEGKATLGSAIKIELL
jgi:hypothetical protein